MNDKLITFSPFFRYPEGARVKQKTLYSSGYEQLKRTLTGVYKYLQVSDYEEASQEVIEDVLSKNVDSLGNVPWLKGLQIQNDDAKIKGEALLEALENMESSSDGEYGVSLKDLTLREFLEFLEEKAISSVVSFFYTHEYSDSNGFVSLTEKSFPRLGGKRDQFSQRSRNL